MDGGVAAAMAAQEDDVVIDPMPTPHRAKGEEETAKLLGSLKFEELMRLALAAHVHEVSLAAATVSASATCGVVGDAAPLAIVSAEAMKRPSRRSSSRSSKRREGGDDEPHPVYKTAIPPEKAAPSGCMSWCRRAPKERPVLQHSAETPDLKPDGFETSLRRIFTRFDMAMSGLVLASAINLYAEVELRSFRIGTALGMRNDSLEDVGNHESAEAFFRSFEQVANVVFMIEMIGRLALQRRRFFWDRVLRQWQYLNILDMFIVVACSIDVFSQSGDSDLSAMRLVRFVRLARAFRVLRVMTSFSKLRILLRTTASSFASLFWAMVLMFLFMYGFAMSLCQALQKSLSDESLPEELRQWIYMLYGSGSRSLWTLFVITFSGGWPNYAQRLIEEVHPVYAACFAVYVWVVIFAVTRIITALFLKDTLHAASEDHEMVLREQRVAKARTMKKLQRVFSTADSSGDGFVSLAEFQAVLSSSTGLAMFRSLDLEVAEACEMFELLDDGDGCVSYEEFCKGVMQLKGQAREMDIVAIMRDCRRILDKVDKLEESCAARTQMGDGAICSVMV